MTRKTELLIIAALSAVLQCACASSAPSESWMREHFAQHKAELERVVSMSNEDFAKTQVTRIGMRFTRLADDWRWPRSPEKIGVTKERWDEYRQLFERLQLVNGIDRDVPQGNIRFVVRAVGLAGDGREWGYLWSVGPPPFADDDREYFATKSLGGSWYLYEWAVY